MGSGRTPKPGQAGTGHLKTSLRRLQDGLQQAKGRQPRANPPQLQRPRGKDHGTQPQPPAPRRHQAIACFAPLRAWRARDGTVTMGTTKDPDTECLDVPCGTCIGCRQSAARHWALRCFLELEDHASATFVTLTYKPEKVPVTLSKRHVQLWLKRLRKAHAKKQRQAGIRPEAVKPLRFFATGEYGETTNRPHYHAIVYSTSTSDAPLIQKTWPNGWADVKPADRAAIAYVAGYAAKKYGDSVQHTKGERIDPETGEVYNYQPPFLQMSRMPGLGATARKKHRNSWRSFAIMDDVKMSVPRYLHEHWKKTATPMEKDKLEDEKYEMKKQIVQTDLQREAAYEIMKKRVKMKRERRTKI